MLRPLLTIFTGLLLCFPSFAAKRDGPQFSTDFEWYNSGYWVDPADNNILDPTGRRLNPPEPDLQTDLRLDSKIQWNNGTKIILRPRFVGDYITNIDVLPDQTVNSSSGSAKMTEGFIDAPLTSTFSTALGLQNYQWGPAEIYSPSNPFFHFSAGQRNYNYIVDGRFLLRSNWNPTPDWSLILLIEPCNNGDSNWVYGKPFYPQGVLKLERKSEKSLSYVGVDGGVMQDDIPFVGEYLNLDAGAGFSFYVDARQSLGSAEYRPELATDGNFDMLYQKDTSVWNSLFVGGIRWEGRVDIRAEYVYNAYGFESYIIAEGVQSALAVTQRGNENLQRLLAPGVEFLGEHYLYLSLRVPDFIRNNFNVFFRHFRSLTDQSGTFQLAGDMGLGDRWTLFAQGTIATGTNTQELSSIEKDSYLAGFKLSF